MPPDVVKRLNAELDALLERPELRETLKREGATPQTGTPRDFGKLIRADLLAGSRWSRTPISRSSESR